MLVSPVSNFIPSVRIIDKVYFCYYEIDAVHYKIINKDTNLAFEQIGK